MHRIFCATPEDLEAECQAFHDVLGAFNEDSAMARGVLFVPVSIPPNMADKRMFQPVIDENIRACRYFVHVIGDQPAAPHRNFEKDCALAIACAADPAWPMSEVVAMTKLPEANSAGVNRTLKYSTIGEFTAHWKGLLAGWLESVVPSP